MMQMSPWCMLWCECSLGSIPRCECPIGACHDANAPLVMQWMQMPSYRCRRQILSGLQCFFYYFGPRAHLWRVSNLGLEPCPFLFIKSLKHFSISCFVFCFASMSYLSLKVMFVFISYHVVFFVFIHVKCHFIVS